MPITTALNSEKLISSIDNILLEWLTDALGVTATISPIVKQDADIEDMKIPRCEYKTTVPSTSSTGAGALQEEAAWKNVTTEIGFKANSRSDEDEYSVVALGDVLDNYFRSADSTKGRKALGIAGLRKGKLTGPLDGNTKKYYHRRWFLTFRVLATNDV